MVSRHVCPLLQKEAPFLSSMATCLTNTVEEIVQNKVQLVPLLQDVQKCKRTIKDCLLTCAWLWSWHLQWIWRVSGSFLVGLDWGEPFREWYEYDTEVPNKRAKYIQDAIGQQSEMQATLESGRKTGRTTSKEAFSMLRSLTFVLGAMISQKAALWMGYLWSILFYEPHARCYSNLSHPFFTGLG